MSHENKTSSRPWYRRLGPGLITACVVIGPGSILTSSKIGAQLGYSMVWVVVVAVLLMMVYMMLGARLGVVSGESSADLLTRKAGRWLAAFVGVSVFFVAGAFQFGNNLGVHAAIANLGEHSPIAQYVDWNYSVVIFNVLAILFVFGFKDLYRALERLMSVFVGVMLVAFAVNLAFARPALGELFAGFVPSLPRGADGAVFSLTSDVTLQLIALVGTTFVIAAAYYQSYLVRQKGWHEKDLADGLIDARVGSAIMALITLMIMATSAAVLRGKDLVDVSEIANQLVPLFGETGRVVFCTGLFCAAFSSFIVNSMIGGFLLADGFGLGSKPTDLWPRLLTVLILLLGMVVALAVIVQGQKPVAAIVLAQALTVIVAPLLAGCLLWLTNSRDVMGDRCNSPAVNFVAGIGFLMLLVMALNTATGKVWPAVANMVAGV
jgi:NRAMP (natural resistance-associated macrophage protein)-like metal ion transporter